VVAISPGGRRRRTPGRLRFSTLSSATLALPVLLLIHGWPTSSIDWLDVAGQLSGRFRVCALDFPGYGFSGKPQGWGYSLRRDAELIEFYLAEVIGAEAAVIVAHDRGDSVTLVHAARCAQGRSAVRLEHLVLSNGNIFLPLSNLTQSQRRILATDSGPQIAAALSAPVLAAGLGATTFTPPRKPGDPEIEALTATFAHGNGMKVLHETIQYLAERSKDEQGWLTALAGRPVPGDGDLGPVRHGFAAAGGQLCVEPVPDAQARRQPLVLHPGRQSLSAGRPARRLRHRAPARARARRRPGTRPARTLTGSSAPGRYLPRTTAGRGRPAPRRRPRRYELKTPGAQATTGKCLRKVPVAWLRRSNTCRWARVLSAVLPETQIGSS
jgi:pimeloyl-ACP methyl ester carboxylesterase